MKFPAHDSQDEDSTKTDSRLVKTSGGTLRCTATGQSIVIDEKPCIVGRGEDGLRHLHVPDDLVSQLQCALVATDKGVLLHDLSRNGTLIVGGRVLVVPGSHVLLQRAATIQVGKTPLKFVPKAARQHLLPTSFGPLQSVATAMRRIFDQLPSLVNEPFPVHLSGETGTGRRYLAEVLHRASNHAHMPFVVVDLTHVAEGRILSELFGHEAGAFRGEKKKESPFVLADGGTIFIAGVHRLSPEAQTRLLRAIDQGHVRRERQSRYQKVNVRIISSCHDELEELVNNETFKGELYARLCGARFHLPPLRERLEDMEILTHQILADLGHADASNAVPFDTIEWMKEQDWRKSNVAQLRDVLTVAVRIWRSASRVGPLDIETAFEVNRRFDQVRSDVTEDEFVLRALTRHGTKLRDVHREATRIVYEMLARECGGNISEMARRCGMSRHHVHKMTGLLGIPTKPDGPPGAPPRKAGKRSSTTRRQGKKKGT